MGNEDFEPYANMPLKEIVSDNPQDCARTMFQEGLVPAANAIIHLAQFGQTERIRFDAARYVVERNLGPIGKGGESGDVWDKLLSDIQED